MIRRLFRLLLPTGLLVAAVLLVRRTMHLRDEGARVVPSPDRWPPIPAPEEASPAPPPAAASDAPAWLPSVDGGCPPTHPVKVKEASGIYHLPGMLYYERTKPDRCYAEESAAIVDGFTKSKR